LVKLGLSLDERRLYASVYHHGSLTAAHAADCLGVFANAVYRLSYELEKLGLVVINRTRPRRIELVDPDIGLGTAQVTHVAELQEMLKTVNLTFNTHAPQVLIGKNELYRHYKIWADNAKRSIKLYTIGIAYSKEIVRAQEAAVMRGVHIQHVVQERRAANYFVLNTWKKLGIEVRIRQQERGFHLMLFDDDLAVVSYSNPDNTDDRVSIVVRHASATRMFGLLFEQVWAESQPMKWIDSDTLAQHHPS